MRVVVAGSSGLIGRELIGLLESAGADVVRLVRRAPEREGEAGWDPEAGVLDPSVLSGADAVVDLCGTSIARLPWTPSHRAALRTSRLSATRTLVDAIGRAEAPPAALLNASAVGFYGDRPGATLTDRSAGGTGFLAGLVAEWEAEALHAGESTRVVLLRTASVVARGGVLRPLIPLTRAGLSGPLGTGRQHWPWISLEDEARAIVHLIGSSAAGPVVLSGPEPATQERFAAHLARLLHRPHVLRAPRFALEALLGDAARDLLLADQRVVPERLLGDGFAFRHPTVEAALDAALSAPRGRDAA